MVLATLLALTQMAPVALFNGRDLTGWTMDVPEMDNNPNARKPFIVRDGKLVSLGSPGGHLVTDKSYSEYRLVAEYRFSATPGNCGILVALRSSVNQTSPWRKGNGERADIPSPNNPRKGR